MQSPAASWLEKPTAAVGAQSPSPTAGAALFHDAPLDGLGAGARDAPIVQDSESLGAQLGHKVSNLYTRAGSPTPVVTVARRGVEAIAAGVVEHTRRR